MTLPVFSGVCHVVADSDLVALLLQQLAHHMAPKLGLTVYDPPIVVPPATICMIWHKRHTGNPAHRWFRGTVLDVLAPLDEEFQESV